MDDLTFPHTLDEVPASAQAKGRFGWGAGTGAVMAASIFVVGSINHAPPIIGFAAIFAWSVVRTRMQLVLFRIARGESHEEVLLERPDAERLFGKMSDRPGSRASR